MNPCIRDYLLDKKYVKDIGVNTAYVIIKHNEIQQVSGRLRDLDGTYKVYEIGDYEFLFNDSTSVKIDPDVPLGDYIQRIVNFVEVKDFAWRLGTECNIYVTGKWREKYIDHYAVHKNSSQHQMLISKHVETNQVARSNNKEVKPKRRSLKNKLTPNLSLIHISEPTRPY